MIFDYSNPLSAHFRPPREGSWCAKEEPTITLNTVDAERYQELSKTWVAQPLGNRVGIQLKTCASLNKSE